MSTPGGPLAEPKKQKRKAPRPDVRYSAEVVTEICTRTAMGQSMRTIAEDPTMPSMRAMVGWQQHKEFAVALDRAREARADARIEAIADLAAAVVAGKLDPNAGRVAIDAQKFLAVKENFKK